MPVVSLAYEFEQPFRVAAGAAYTWCTDFGPTDGALMGEGRRRTVRRLTDDALILTDTTFPDGRPQRIRRLVRLDPQRLGWTNTHLDGPFRHSQYWYRILADGERRSHLEFRGRRLMTIPPPASAGTVRRLTDAERREDSTLWKKRLAPALERAVAKAGA